jgi:adenylate cyclase
LRGKVDGHLVDIGHPKLKNMSRPVQVFRLLDDTAPAGTASPSPGTFVPGFGRPAIVVLPLDTFTQSAEDAYFADGLSEDITTALATWRFFPVIARNSAFSFKGRKIEVRSVAHELGARYVVEGSVRRHGNNVRVTVQLIEADSEHHIFAEHYDRTSEDLLGVQEEIATAIVAVLEPELLRVERDRASARPVSVAAYDMLQRGLWHHYRRTREDAALAIAFLRRAIEADPHYAQIAAALSICLSQSMLSGWLDDPKAAVAEAFELGRKAILLDGRDPMAHFALGVAAMHSGQRALAVSEFGAAVLLNPSYASAHALLGNQHNYAGRPQEALASIMRALRLSPNDPHVFLWIPALAASHYLAGSYEEAIEAAQRGLTLRPDYLHPLRYLVAALGQLGRREEAQQWLSQLRLLDKHLAATKAFLEAYYDAGPLARVLEGLGKAGFE